MNEIQSISNTLDKYQAATRAIHKLRARGQNFSIRYFEKVIKRKYAFDDLDGMIPNSWYDQVKDLSNAFPLEPGREYMHKSVPNLRLRIVDRNDDKYKGEMYDCLLWYYDPTENTTCLVDINNVTARRIRNSYLPKM